MRLSRIALSNYPPIRSLEIATSAGVVVIAGANGSGKTRLKQAIVQSFRSPNSPPTTLSLEATRDEEESAWGARTLTITAGQQNSVLETYLRTRRGSSAYTGAVAQIDSDRAVQPVRFEQFSLATMDPDDEDVNYSWYLTQFNDRWQQLVNKIYKKAANRDQKIAKFVKENPSATGATALSAHPDPFLPYQQIFSQLLPGKNLEPIDPKAPREFHYRVGDGAPMPLTTLSSGEQEVVKVAFDLVWKQITHSIILVDEPELHLHPTLTFRLIETLKGFGGETNQLVLFTHSADLISTYFSTGSVFFIDIDQAQANQAQRLSALTNDHAVVARSAGANLGLFAVGKRLVFVEGTSASVDRLVYHKVAQRAFPDSYILPIGSVENLAALNAIVDELSRAVFGIDLFLVRDRDGLSDDAVARLQATARFRCLPVRHIENYLLDADVLAAVATMLYLPEPLRSSAFLATRTAAIAAECVMPAVLWNIREQIRLTGVVAQPSVRDVATMSVDDLASAVCSQLAASTQTMSAELTKEKVAPSIRLEHERLSASVADGTFRRALPGKIIFQRLCGDVLNADPVQIREAYVDVALRTKPDALKDISDILAGFAAVARV